MYKHSQPSIPRLTNRMHPMSFCRSQPSFIRCQYAARELEKIMARMPEVEGSFAWRMLNDERVGMYMNGRCEEPARWAGRQIAGQR